MNRHPRAIPEKHWRRNGHVHTWMVLRVANGTFARSLLERARVVSFSVSSILWTQLACIPYFSTTWITLKIIVFPQRYAPCCSLQWIAMISSAEFGNFLPWESLELYNFAIWQSFMCIGPLSYYTQPFDSSWIRLHLMKTTAFTFAFAPLSLLFTRHVMIFWNLKLYTRAAYKCWASTASTVSGGAKPYHTAILDTFIYHLQPFRSSTHYLHRLYN